MGHGKRIRKLRLRLKRQRRDKEKDPRYRWKRLYSRIAKVGFSTQDFANAIRRLGKVWTKFEKGKLIDNEKE